MVIETYRHAQAIVEHWTQQKQIEGFKDSFEEDITFVNDVRDHSKWMSEPKVLGSRVLRAKIFFAIKTNTEFRD